MSAKRVLILGTCGIKKSKVAERIRDRCDQHHHQSLKILDFERDFLVPAIEKPLSSFLRDEPREQFRQWEEGWERLEAGHPFDEINAPTLLLLHGAIVTGQYGVRAVYNLDRVRRFQPNLVLTLIDNVYDMWWRTESKAGKEGWKGRPTLEQLIVARRVEQLVGDQIANHVEPKARHVVLSVEHPSECAARLILGNPRIVYLAFPISEPRRMVTPKAPAAPDHGGVDAVNELHSKAFAYQKDNPNYVFISPLGIDERPLSDVLKNADRMSELAATIDEGGRMVGAIHFPRDEFRWTTTSFWPAGDILSAGLLPDPKDQVLPLTQVENAAGAIKTDVGWRDYRLVLQAYALAAFNPVMNNRDQVSGGVRDEIDYAVMTRTPVYVYQNPQHDGKRTFQTQLVGEDSSMGTSERREYIIWKDINSVEDLLHRAAPPET